MIDFQLSENDQARLDLIRQQALICRDTDPSMPLPESTRREAGVLVYSFDLQSV